MVLAYHVIPQWPSEAVSQLAYVLTMVATHPDAYDNDLRSIAVLADLRLAAPKWLKEWVEFKKERMAVRDELLRRVEKQLKGA